MGLNLTEDIVIQWYKIRWNGRFFFSKQPWPVNLETSLSTGDHAWIVESGEEIMNDFFHRFNVSPVGFNLLTYWPVEPGWIPNILLPAAMRVIYTQPEALTLKMLAESAEAGCWLFN